MDIVLDREVLEKQDNIACIKEYIKKYEEKFDEKLSDAEDDTEVMPIPKREVKKKTAEDYFKVVLSSGLDTIIEKIYKKETYQMVMMPSQDKYLIKKGEVIQTLENMSCDDFLNFFKQLKNDDFIPVNNIIFNKIEKNDLSKIYQMIKNLRHFLSGGMMSLELYKEMTRSGYRREGEEIYYEIYQNLLKNEKLLKYMAVKSPMLDNAIKYNDDFVSVALALEEFAGYDHARYFVESFTKSSLQTVNGRPSPYGYYRSYYNNGSDIHSMIKTCLNPKYNLNTKRFIDYLCFDCYGQGFTSMPLRTYMDYLNMCHAYYGKVPNKYPKMLLTEHDIISQKVETSDEIKKILEAENRQRTEVARADKELREANFTADIFKQQYENFEKEYPAEDGILFSYKDLILVKAESAKALVDEGFNLGHCVATYIKSVASGECLILFVRHKDHPEESYLTVEIRKCLVSGKCTPRYIIAQIQGDGKRTILTESERKFFELFMKKTNIETTNSNFR